MTSLTREERAPLPAGPTRVLIVDDHPMVRAGLRALLDVPDIEIVGEAVSGPAAVEAAGQEHPDVVLMDVRMPDGNGLDATSAVRRVSPDSRVLIITSFEEEDYLRSAIAAGADGFLLKRASRALLLDSIRMVQAGGSTFPRDMLAGLAAPREAAPPPPGGSAPEVVEVGNLRIDADRHLVFVAGEPLVLTYLEFQALSMLAHAAGDVVTYERLQAELWPDDRVEGGEPSRIVSLIARLRSRLGPGREYLQTVKRVGYRLAEAR